MAELGCATLGLKLSSATHVRVSYLFWDIWGPAHTFNSRLVLTGALAHWNVFGWSGQLLPNEFFDSSTPFMRKVQRRRSLTVFNAALHASPHRQGVPNVQKLYHLFQQLSNLILYLQVNYQKIFETFSSIVRVPSSHLKYKWKMPKKMRHFLFWPLL